jgi:2-hydroxy-3-oxopropionate reductase
MMDFIKAYGVDGDAQKLAFAVKNAAKDVGYYAQMARDASVESLMSGCALRALNEARDAGHGDLLVPQMVDVFAARFGK